MARDVALNASGTLAMLIGGWLIAADRGVAQLPRSTGFAAIAVTVVVVSAAGAAVLLTWWEESPLLGKLRDLGVNVVANLFAAALVWLLLLVTGRVGPGPEMVIAAALLVALPLLIWFKFARDVGVNLLSTVVVLSGSWLLATADGSVRSSLPITLAAVAGVLLPAAALMIMVAVDVRTARRHTDRAALLARTVSVELAANLVAAAAVALALAAFGLLRIDTAMAFLAMQFVMTPVMILLLEVAEEFEFYGANIVTFALFQGLRGLTYLLLVAVFAGFPIAVWNLLGKPDLRCFALLAVLGLVQLFRVTSRRQQEHGERDPVYQRLNVALALALNPVWTTADVAMVDIITSPGTPGWVRDIFEVLLYTI
ncbi:hypothetical protein HDA40_007693 [Hamadaea flava]|uniref:Uncharacterized protein n=1 Tax=Hamadaea flava TaxID=1742688 RepID=A0ABV8LXK4_9ACTN|nr:hypothetical protein [Hamadaea flava]MCP2329186.1 hypothetical protein [Hamadaea flava]